MLSLSHETRGTHSEGLKRCKCVGLVEMDRRVVTDALACDHLLKGTTDGNPLCIARFFLYLLYPSPLYPTIQCFPSPSYIPPMLFVPSVHPGISILAHLIHHFLLFLSGNFASSFSSVHYPSVFPVSLFLLLLFLLPRISFITNIFFFIPVTRPRDII